MRRNSKLLAITMLIAAVLFFMPVFKAFAYELPDVDKPSSLSMTLKSSDDDSKVAAGAEITCYLVAKMKVAGGVSYEFTDPYKACGLDIENKITQSMIDDLLDYTIDNNVTGITAVSDSNGDVVFDGLVNGLYLIAATSLPEGFTSFVPFMYYLPYYAEDGSGWVYDGVAEPKISYYPPTDVTVKKVWNDDGTGRPDSVKINLKNEDGVYDTVTLDENNEWKYEWTGLDATKKWAVEEVSVPDGYKVTYSADGFDFTVTNTAKLIQTGQINWPVPVMVFAGAFLVCAGILIKLPKKNNNED